jgi:hypothetical protein
MKRKVFRIAGITALVLLILFAGLAVWLKLFFPADGVRWLVESTVERTTGRQCSVGEVGISFRRGFAVNLSEIEVASHPDEIAPYLLRIDNLYLKFRLLPLLMRRVEIASLSLIHPEIYMETDKTGVLNAARAFRGKPGEPQEEPAGEKKTGFSLVLLAVSAEEATVYYLDQRNKLEMALGPLEAHFTLSGLKDGEPSPTIEGRVHLEGIKSSSSETFFRLGALLPLEMNFSARLARAGEKLSFEGISLESITLDFTGIRLTGTGRLDGLGKKDLGYSVSLEGTADELAPLSGLLTESGKPGGLVEELEGRIQLAARIEHKPGAEQGPEFSLQARLENLDARIGQAPFSLDGRIVIEQGYPFNFRLKAGLELNGLPQLIPALEGWYMAGKIDTDLKLTGSLENIAALSTDGTLAGEGLALQPPQGRSRLGLPRAYLRLAGHDLEQGKIELAAKESRLNLEAEIKNYPALLFQEKMDARTASWKLDATGASLSLQDFFPVNSAGYIDRAEKHSALRVYNLPFSLGLGIGRLKAGRLNVTPEIALDSVELAFRVRDSLIVIQRIDAGFFSGRLAGNGSITLGKAGLPGYVLDLKAAQASAGELLSPFSKLGSYLTGVVSTEIHLERQRGGEKSLDENLSGHAEFTLSQGRLTGWPALERLARLTKIEELKDLAIEQWIGKFEIRDERVYGDNLEIKTTVSDLLVSGSVGFDGSLDYSLTLVLSENLTRKYRSKLPGEIASLLTGKKDRLELDFKIGGTTHDPLVNWDTRPVARRLGKKLGSQLDKLIDRLLPSKPKEADSTSAGSDSTEMYR